ncbi:hypothetical protein [uncultured Cedecea sp.]|uniref:HofO family protein n=1 Tax=uncultured Cedecea sp. TaxID=988762 RepID=UPI002608E362|nr:hypothetical protein [uncultured Cedecea sp.]
MSHLKYLFIHSSRRYFLIILSGLLLTGIVAGYLLQADYQQQYRYIQQRNMRLEQHIVTLKQEVNTLPPATSIFTPVAVAPVFSVIEILKKSGGRLINWQPGEPQETLEFLLRWEKVPWIFRHLSYYQGINLTSFSIGDTKDPMVVMLTLVFSHENK